jgi:hypothetical protein
MALTVSDIQERVAALVDQESSAPTAGGDDWNLRLTYINRAQREWSETAPWSCLYKEYTAQTAGSATISLPSDFRKLAGYPQIAAEEYPEIRPQEKEQHLSTDEFCYVLGDEGSGYSLIVNTAKSSGASLMVPYLSTPAALVSPADSSPIPNPEYLVARTVAYLWEAREDERFPLAKTESDKILARMLELENDAFDQASYNQVKTVEQTKYNFRIGKN